MRRMERHDDEWTPGDRPASGPPDAPAAEAMPRWVKVVLGIGLALLLLVAALNVFGGGQHGPGRHFPAGAAAPVVAGLLTT